MLLAPVSAIAVSEIAVLGGVGLQLGIEVKFLLTREFLSLLGLEIIKKILHVDPCRQVKASQPWLFSFPGPEGLERVADSLWPASLFLQFALVCWQQTPQPWEEQKPPKIQQFFTADWRSLMVC